MISFKGAHFPKDIILMAVRWYVAYSLSYRQIEELLAERGIAVDHATFQRWVVKYAPLLAQAFQKRKKRVGKSWYADETYLKIKGQWVYYYRAIDKQGQTLDCYLSAKRDLAAAKAFFTKVIESHGLPVKVTIDKSGANLAALNVINSELETQKPIEIRQIKYLNNRLEQDHRFIKRLTKPMLGFKSMLSAAATLAGIELHHMLKKEQYNSPSSSTVWLQFCALAA